MKIQPIAIFHSPFSSKFGIPKQSGLVKELEGTIVLTEPYRSAEALRGIDSFDYLWLIWGFSANKHAANGLTVRPPLLGGNTRLGVFATRSPFRPNPLGLSSVRLKSVEWETSQGPVLHVLGADLMDGTPIFDIKPYVTYADCHEGAKSGFVDQHPIKRLQVIIPDNLAKALGEQQAEALRQVLELDPRPHYQHDPNRVYGMPFAGRDIHFKVEGDTLTVIH
jgi:tRNA-Thr(GGU) m(6)t(6)A37 methyltransferase TsaA